MADTRTMAELLRASTEGNAEAIVVPTIPDEHFELKHSLLNLVTSKQFFVFEKEDPHAHIRWFNKITSTMKYKDVPDSAIKLMFFPFSIDGPVRIWLEKEPPRSIKTWDDLVSKFINKFFPPSKTTNLRNEISNFQQRFDELFHETWDRFKDLLRTIISDRERTVGENRASWSDKLEDALWAFRTAFKTPIGCTPYKLVYGKACHLPIELKHKAYWALKHCNFDLKTAGDHREVQINELNELRDQAYENSLIYKEKTKKIHDSKIKNHVFSVGDRVLLFNSRLKIFSGKLKTRWTGPFTVTQVFPYGTVELSSNNERNFKVNDHRLKHYFGGDIPPMVVPDLQTFPMDN
ncbi:reverse transcriptase domain-containing protein [Tanacetum coccineum]